MGNIAEQSLRNIIILFGGVFLGALNIIFLYPTILSDAEFGLTRILVSISILAANIGAFGAPSILIKFLPFYNSSTVSKSKLFGYIFRLGFIGMLVVFLLLIILKSLILSFYNENAAYFGENYYLIFPLVFLIISNSIFSSFSKGLLKSVLQNFLNDIVIRLIHTVLLILLFIEVIDFNLFLYGFIGGYAVVSLILFFHLINTNELTFLNHNKEKINNSNKMITYGGANFLSGLAGNLTNRIDSLMIAGMVGCALCGENKGLESIAIYSWGLYVASLVEMPGRAVTSIALPFISQFWKNNDKSNINKLYKSSSITQLIVGTLLFLGIWINVDLLFLIKPEFQEARWVIFFLGFGKLIHISAGLNGSIILTSKYYYFSTVFMIFLSIVTFLTNLLLIPEYGIVGASIATTISIIIYNIISFFFLLIKYKMQPFTIGTLIVILIAFVSYLIANSVQFTDHLIFNSFIKSVLLIVIFVPLVLVSKASQDINKWANKILLVLNFKK